MIADSNSYKDAAAAMRTELVEYLKASITHHAPFLAHVCARFNALDQFDINNVDRPRNLSWLFIFVHQYLFQTVKLIRPQEWVHFFGQAISQGERQWGFVQIIGGEGRFQKGGEDERR
jgi:hypothetical protein